MATNAEMKTEFSYFSEIWKFFKRYYDVQQSDEYWEALMEDASAINQKYQCELCTTVIMAVVDELERIDKRNREVER